MTNIGTRPTLYENYQRVVESHILDFGSDVYGERVELRFYKRLREERIFPSVMELSAQIGRDVEATREYFAARRRLEKEAGDPARTPVAILTASHVGEGRRPDGQRRRSSTSPTRTSTARC